MAEVKINQLPIMPSSAFTDNDYFLVVDDGGARLLARPTLQAWIRANVQGEQGNQGVAGRDGINGINGADGVNGRDGLSAYQVAVNNGYVGTQSQWLASLVGAKGATGSSGVNGNHGWSPILKTVTRGNDIVLQVSDWTGGTGVKPSVGQYLSSNGLVVNIADADNVRGIQGIQGEQGLQGEKGVDGKTINSVTFNSDQSIKFIYSDNTSVTSNTPPKQHGWGTYKDSQYTDATPFNLPANTQVVIPNNATNNIEQLPDGVTTFYNLTSQKYILSDSLGFYSVRVRFKVSGGNQQSFINISMSKDTTETPYSEDRVLRGDSQIQNLNFETVMYGDEALASNGLTIRIKSYDRPISIYNIEVTVAKLI